jgi:choline-sulfatase
MKTLNLIHLLMFVVILVITRAGTVKAAKPAPRPNILFVCADDQAPWALGASGNTQAITPNMDCLVSQSAYLVNSFVTSPICSPSRAATLTGLYGHEVGVRNWVQFGERAGGQGIDPHSVTIAELLQKAGYSTSLIGKWHLGEEVVHHPNNHGFDYFMGHIQGGFAVNDPKFQRNGEAIQFKGLTADILADDVISRLKVHAAQKQDQPFYIAWHTRAPHTRWLPVSPEDAKPYGPDFDPVIPNPDFPNLDVPRVKKWMKEYLSSVRSVDRNLGRVMTALEKLGLNENTVVVYTSDHGYNMGHHGIWHKGNGHWILKQRVPQKGNIGPNQRPNMWENSIRVPSIVRWPGRIKPGIRIDADTTNLDWFPTFLAMAGIEQSKRSGARGEDLVPLLTGKAKDTKRDGVFSFLSFYEGYRSFIGELRMWRTDRWKLVRDFRNPHLDELYDLKNDPGELKNEIKNPKYNQVIAGLHARILDEMRLSKDPALKYVKAHTAGRHTPRSPNAGNRIEQPKEQVPDQK